MDEDLATSDLGRSLMVVRGTPLRSGGRSACGPGTPADRAAMLRESLSKALADPKFLAETKNAQIEVGHIGADEVTKAFNAMVDQPPQVLDVMHKYLKAGGD